jgi:hypothetical protein
MEVMTMENDAAVAAQRMMCGKSDRPEQWRDDGLSAFRAL